MINRITSLFAPKPNVPGVLPQAIGPYDEAIKINRASLCQINDWIDEEAFKKSCFEYGVPGFIGSVITNPINDDLTYSDLLVQIAKKYFSAINYLEIGVSVGKNFYQSINGGVSGSFTGFDIEEINPVLERVLSPIDKQQWETMANSIKKVPSSLSQYNYKNNKIQYLSADVWDEKSWARLKGEKFNIVFSDALHSPKAILFEFEMLVKYDLLDDRFVMVWDDLIGKMKYSFYRILKKYDKQYKIRESCLVNINGWVGEHESPHTIGLISNFTF